MASTGFGAGCFGRREDFARRRFLRGRFFVATVFLDLFDFLADAFFATRGFALLDIAILCAISAL
jgi:hypothetical protein